MNKKKYYEIDETVFYRQGIVKLFHRNKQISARRFGTKKVRQKIINSWFKRYKVDKNVFLQVLYDEKKNYKNE